MAIVKMKHLRLVAMSGDREKLLKLLQRMGCVEIREPSLEPEDPLWTQLSRPEAEGLAGFKEEQTGAERALEALKKYAPEKTGFLEPKPTLKESELFDAETAQKARTAAAQVNEAERRLAAIQGEETKLLSQKEQLAPWLGLDMALDTASTDRVTIQLGTLPAQQSFEQAVQTVTGLGELVQLTQVSGDRDLQYCLLVCHNSQSQEVLDALKELGWSRANLREWSGTAKENTKRLDQELEELAKERAQLEQKLAEMGGVRSSLRRLSDYDAVEITRRETVSRTLDTSQTFLLEGWVSADGWPKLERELQPYACAFEVRDPTQEEYPQVPVKLKNNWFTRPLNMVTDMYSLPSYNGVDPNPLMAPFFILFYGMMMADMGYGILMILAAVVVMKKQQPDGPTMRHMMPLLGLCGVSTFLWGAATGGFFGDFLTQIVLLTTGKDFALPALFSPLDDAVPVLIGSLILGVLQVFTGMAVSMYRQFKQGEVMAALCNEGAWYLVFLLAALAAVGVLPMKAALIAIVVVLVLGLSYGKQGIVGKIMGIFGGMYNGITGYFSDILSYSRLMALMLAGAVVAQVFNQLGAMTGNVITFVLIAMVGNALNFALNLLGCYVHDMRLQCLEFFGRFYEDGGKAFTPLDVNTKYVKIVKE